MNASTTSREGAGSTGPAVVVIGRNEGERLRRCLESVVGQATLVVYVDSGSSDGSVELARGLGAVVHQLDMRLPFTAARARNEGLKTLLAHRPATPLVQFVDGDCEVAPGWIATASAFLASQPQVTAVFGRRRERHPERSIFNLLCDLEWDTPLGEARACGGDVLMRTAPLLQVGGYRDDLIAGEEPELCIRLRAKGWKIWRIAAEMTLHDAAMLHLSQWWKRCMRAGFAFAEGVRLHGAPPERHWVREWRSAWLWGAALPLAILVLALLFGAPALLLFAIYPVQVLRLGFRMRHAGKAGWARALFLVAGKFPEAAGQLKSWLMHVRQQRPTLIEYK